ncbi:MAG: cation:proton antiporter [Chloroflexi bacterium]|nr:MAG: cation:proton antiporter [Chloroflexota bacterium]
MGTIFLWIAILLILAKTVSLIERFGQPAVLGELVLGVVLGNLALLGFNWFEPVKTNDIMLFLAELGVVILLFQVGLESNIAEMRKVGLSSFLVAVVGVILPFALGTWVVGPWLLPGLSFNAYLFLGAALTATSVGITARVFRDLGALNSDEAKIVLGAAVIDDVLGLIILAVVSAIVSIGSVSGLQVAWILAKAVLFLGGAIVLGQLLAPWLGELFSKINAGIGMKFTLAFSTALILAFLAEEIGLAPIVGAFTAGLILDPVHFRSFYRPEITHHLRKTLKNMPDEVRQSLESTLEAHEHQHVAELIEPVAYAFVPLFFVLTGMAVDITTLFNLPILLVAVGITAVAIIGKLAAGWVAGGKVNKMLVGWGMVPRGEVGLIFATIGRSLGVMTPEAFSVVVVVVIFTTLLPPPILTAMLKKAAAKAAVEQTAPAPAPTSVSE